MRRNLKGQIALMVMLVMVIALTVVTAVIARTITDIRISSETEGTLQALNAAESGIAQGLANPTAANCDVAGSVFNNTARTTCSIKKLGPDAAGNYSLGLIKRSDARTIWLVNHDNNDNPILTNPFNGYCGQLTVTWDQPKKTEFILLSTSGEHNEKIVSSSQTISYNFISGLNQYGCSAWGGPMVLRIMPLEADINVNISVSDPSTFPTQGYTIDSTGLSAPNSAFQGAARRIVYEKWYPDLPGIFDYVLFSYGDISK